MSRKADQDITWGAYERLSRLKIQQAQAAATGAGTATPTSPWSGSAA